MKKTTYTILRQEMRMNKEGYASWYAGTAVTVASSTDFEKCRDYIAFDTLNWVNTIKARYGYTEDDIKCICDLDMEEPTLTVDCGSIYWIYSISSCRTI